MSLKDYSPVDAPVVVLFRNLGYPGRVKDASGSFERPVYLVELDEPIPFQDHVQRAHIEDPRALERQMTSDGCLEDGLVTCMWVYWEDLELEPSYGTYTEYMEPDPVPKESCKGTIRAMRTWPGQVVFIDDAPVLELLDPVPLADGPETVDPRADISDFIGEGSDLLAAIPVDVEAADRTHGFRLMRPEVAAYYASFE